MVDINIRNYEKILEEGMILDHYFLLCSIRDGSEIPKSKRISGFKAVLTRKGYLLDGTLTDKALDILGNSNSVTSTTTEKMDFDSWVVQVHAKCVNKLVELIGRKQIRSRIKGGKSYPFLDGPMVLRRSLTRLISAYKIKDYEGIERCMINHIIRCKKEGEWFPLMKYYIIKDGQSTLMTDLESDEQQEQIQDNTVNI